MPSAAARAAILGRGVQPLLDYDFTGASLPAGAVYARASAATDALWTDAPGTSYNTYATDEPRLLGSLGYLTEISRQNRLRNSATPASHTTFNLTVGSWCFWMTGTGSCDIVANTAVGTGWGTITAGNPIVIAITTAGTSDITVTGSVDRFQIELGTFPTSLIITTSAVVVRATDALYFPNNFTSWRQPTIIANGTQLGIPGVGNAWLAMMGDSAQADFLGVKNNVTDGYMVANQAGIEVLPFQTVVRGQPLLAGVSATGDSNYGAGYTGGQPMSYVGPTSVLTYPPRLGATRFNIGALGNLGQPWNGYITRFRYWDQVLTNSQMLNIMSQS